MAILSFFKKERIQNGWRQYLNNNFLYLGMILYFLGGIVGWFQNNLWQFSDWWKDRGSISVLVFSIPIGYTMYYAWKYFVLYFGSTWSARMMFFALSYMIFPILTYLFLNESPFTIKNIISIILSILIIVVQIKL